MAPLAYAGNPPVRPALRPTPTLPAEEPSLSTSTPPPAQLVSGRRPTIWLHPPLHAKATFVTLLATLAGVAEGRAQAELGMHPLAVTVSVVGLVVVFVWLAHRWVWSPTARLVRQLESWMSQPPPDAEDERQLTPHDLPFDRPDELGRIARAVRELHDHRVREAHEARRLRRTLDLRVAEATRQATLQLRRDAMRDPLTGLANRRFLEEHLEELVRTERGAGRDLACLAIDLDYFKDVNDTLGHAAGDQALIFLAKLIEGSIRPEDVALRVGGDEFLVLLPGCGVDRAVELGRQLASLFRQHVRTALYEGCRAGTSIGVASLSQGPDTGRALLVRADGALYDAKRSGKGRVAGG